MRAAFPVMAARARALLCAPALVLVVASHAGAAPGPSAVAPARAPTLVLVVASHAGAAPGPSAVAPARAPTPAQVVASHAGAAPGPSAVAPARAPTPAPAAAARPVPAADPLRAIAIAEDERRGSDGELRGYLAHPDAGVRARAVLAVGRLQDPAYVADLLPLLEDASPEVRRETAFALGQIGQRPARAALEKALGRGDAELTRLAIEALGKLGDRASTRRVVALLDNPSPVLRGEAAVALWRLADSSAVDALIAHDDDADPGVRWRILYALEKVVAPDPIVLRAALKLEDPDPVVRAFAARTIGRQKHARGMAYLINALQDPEAAVVVNAVRALQQIGDSTCSACGPALLRSLGHANPYVRVVAATALAERFAWAGLDSAGRGRLEDALAGRLRDPDAATRGAAARALLARRGEAALAAVEPLLGDSSLYVRAALLGGLGGLGASSRAADLVRARLAAGRSLIERMAAAEVLGVQRGPHAMALLRAGLADTSMLFAASCASALEEARDTLSVPLLARAYAARAGEAEADARVALRDALRTLAGRAFADSVELRNPVMAAIPRSYSPDFARAPVERGALLHTSRGDIEWAFFGREAPQTVKNFIRLAERGYFNGLVVHRVVPNFVIQDGDPTGTGSGGPGYTIRCEYNALQYGPGMVGMALSGKDTGGSQWFITHSPQPHLNGRYTIFARVASGMDVVRSIVQGDRVLGVEILN